jgi:death-on-curing protein
VKRPVWIYRETVLTLHEQLLAIFGGSSGIRDAGLLDSALARPENLVAYGTPDVFDLAASYGFGLVMNHPFVDGNKRTGFAVAVLFLELNGCRFEAGEADATVRTLALAAGDMQEAEYAAWLKANSRRVSKRRKK